MACYLLQFIAFDTRPCKFKRNSLPLGNPKGHIYVFERYQNRVSFVKKVQLKVEKNDCRIRLKHIFVAYVE